MARRPLELASTMAELPALPTHYEQLDVAPTATMEDIRAAYQTWLAAHAAAEGATPTDAEAPPVDPLTADETAAKHLAHAVLSDPLRRRVYDAFLVSHAQVVGASQRWWRRRSVRRGLSVGLALLVMVGAMAGVAWLIWRAS